MDIGKRVHAERSTRLLPCTLFRYLHYLYVRMTFIGLCCAVNIHAQVLWFDWSDCAVELSGLVLRVEYDDEDVTECASEECQQSPRCGKIHQK